MEQVLFDIMMKNRF